MPALQFFFLPQDMADTEHGVVLLTDLGDLIALSLVNGHGLLQEEVVALSGQGHSRVLVILVLGADQGNVCQLAVLLTRGYEVGPVLKDLIIPKTMELLHPFSPVKNIGKQIQIVQCSIFKACET